MANERAVIPAGGWSWMVRTTGTELAGGVVLLLPPQPINDRQARGRIENHKIALRTRDAS